MMGFAGGAGTRGDDHCVAGEARAARRSECGGRPERREKRVPGGKEEPSPTGGSRGCGEGRGALMNQFKCMR